MPVDLMEETYRGVPSAATSAAIAARAMTATAVILAVTSVTVIFTTLTKAIFDDLTASAVELAATAASAWIRLRPARTITTYEDNDDVTPPIISQVSTIVQTATDATSI